MSVITAVIPPPLRIICIQTEQEFSGRSLPQLPAIITNISNSENYVFPDWFTLRLSLSHFLLVTLACTLCFGISKSFLQPKSKLLPYIIITSFYNTTSSTATTIATKQETKHGKNYQALLTSFWKKNYCFTTEMYMPLWICLSIRISIKRERQNKFQHVYPLHWKMVTTRILQWWPFKCLLYTIKQELPYIFP